MVKQKNIKVCFGTSTGSFCGTSKNKMSGAYEAHKIGKELIFKFKKNKCFSISSKDKKI